jgi:hypothetical protein
MFEVVIGGWGNKQSVSLHKVSPSHSLSLALFWLQENSRGEQMPKTGKTRFFS